MFTKIRRTIKILRSPADVEMTEVPRTDEIERARLKADGQMRHSNPVLKVIEGVFVIVVSVFMISPFLHRLFSLGDNANIITTSAISVVLFSLWDRLQETASRELASMFRLDFLDPYVGRRVKRTIAIFKAK
jgi:hypothetical protein